MDYSILFTKRDEPRSNLVFEGYWILIHPRRTDPIGWDGYETYLLKFIHTFFIFSDRKGNLMNDLVTHYVNYHLMHFKEILLGILECSSTHPIRGRENQDR
ncbi:MAG: hypothetical protein ACMUEM_02315 [Flavobacteriales bacterium AspAUS03]